MHDEEQIKLVAAEIKERGFLDPIDVDEKMNILAGHGRYAAMLHLKRKQVQVVVHRGLTKKQREAYIVADNQTTMLTGFDNAKLTEELGAIPHGEERMGKLGFTNDERALFSPKAMGQGELSAAVKEDPSSWQNLVPPVHRSTVKFDNMEQKEVWDRFLLAIRSRYPQAETIADALMAYAEEFGDGI